MVLESVGLAGMAGGLHSLFSYNRENFMFDREMRQKQEFQILAFRNKQAELWRDDIRDIIGMTEKKMDSYLVIATLQLGMCVGLFCEGRLEPGTPPWLLAFYMLALGGAFMYLLMAVWFAMHASVVANCSSVRLLTQFVRLPVPTWEHLEDLRTYASSYESVDWQHMLRVPFTGSRSHVRHCGAEHEQEEQREATPGMCEPSASSLGADVSRDGPEPAHVADPWGLERHGHRRDLYELEDKHPSLRAHIGLARRASMQFQCFDAYARVAMTFGTNQLLNAVAYYCIGYLAVQDGAIWPSWCIVVIMISIMITLINVDISLSARQRALATLLQLTGPILCATATTGWILYRRRFEHWFNYLLPVAYAAHGMWLLWVLGAIGIEKQGNGSVLPKNFRSVLYLDVFGWLGTQQRQRGDIRASKSGGSLLDDAGTCTEAHEAQRYSADSAEMRYQEMLEVQKELRSDLAKWKSDELQQAMSEGRFGPTTIAFGDGEAPTPASTEDGAGDVPVSNGATPKRAGGEATPKRMSSDPETACTSASTRPTPWMPGIGAPKVSPSSSPHREPVCVQGKTCHKAPRSSSNLFDQSIVAASELGTPMVKAFSLLMEDDPVMAPLVDSHDGIGTETPKDPAPPSQSGPRATHTVRLPPKHAFNPSSYAPPGFVTTKAVADVDEGEAIVSGQETMHPGKLPAKVFRLGTALLAALWTVGVAYPCHHVRELMTTPALSEVFVEEERPVEGRGWEEMQVQGAMGTDPNGLPMFIPLPQLELPPLGPGELMDVEWPKHAGFFPRALSCDDSGKQLLVADDIGLYYTQLDRTGPPDNASLQTGAGRLLRGVAGSAAPGAPGSAAPRRLRFTRVDRCSALEGQALKDVSVVCTETGPGLHCHALVLLGVGPTLVECPLSLKDEGNRSRSSSADVDTPRKPGTRRQNWTIGHDWLHREVRQERVDALAVHNHCLRLRGQSSLRPGICAFEAEEVGCVVVGTSHGRIVQLRGDMEREGQLVPERSIHQRSTPVTHGSLHVLASGAVMALSRQVSLSEGSEGRRERRVKATAQAFDGEEGNLIGQWELPEDIDWLTMSAGGDGLLAVGLRDQRDLQLYRFPLPTELMGKREAVESAAEGEVEFATES